MPQVPNVPNKKQRLDQPATQTPKQFANELRDTLRKNVTGAIKQGKAQPIREIRNAKELNDSLTVRTENGAKKQVPRPADAPKAEIHTPQPVKETKMASKTKKGATRATKKGSVSKKVPTNRCECGCGTLTRKSFAPGHDQRLVGMIKRGELRSLNAFQSEFAKSHGIRLGESKKAEPKKSPAKRTRAA